MKCFNLLTCALLSLVLGADQPAPPPKPDAPKSPDAISAIKKHDAAIVDAEEVCRTAKIKATRTLIDELKQVQAKVMGSKGAPALPEGNAIQAVIDQARAELQQLESRGTVRTVTVVVQSNLGWQEACDVVAGQKISVSASGEWNLNPSMGNTRVYGPDGATDWGYLAGRIGTDKAFRVGKQLSFTADSSGVLAFRCNDNKPDDNKGELEVKILIQNASP